MRALTIPTIITFLPSLFSWPVCS